MKFARCIVTVVNVDTQTNNNAPSQCKGGHTYGRGVHVFFGFKRILIEQ